MKDSYDSSIIKEPLYLGIPIIDQQHANLVRITNNLYLSCLTNSTFANLRFIQAVRETVAFIQQHFSTEEKLMLLSGFPNYDDHKKDHGDFVWEIISRSKQFQDGQKCVPQKFVQFLSEWVKIHIGGADKEFADFFLNMKQHNKFRMVLTEEFLEPVKTA